MGVRPHSTCGELFKRIVKALKVDEDRTFGLSVIQDKGKQSVCTCLRVVKQKCDISTVSV